MEMGEREIICLSLHCHHQNDSCIKMGRDESHFNVSVGSDGQSHKTVHKPQPFWRERRTEAVSNRSPSAYQPNALPLARWRPWHFYSMMSYLGVPPNSDKRHGQIIYFISFILPIPLQFTSPHILNVNLSFCIKKLVAYREEEEWPQDLFILYHACTALTVTIF